MRAGAPPGSDASERWIAHAVAAVFQVAGETAQEAGIRIRHDREVVPAERLLELPALAVAVAGPQQARDGVVVSPLLA